LHEWLGIAVSLPILLHLLFAWSWIVVTTKRFLHATNKRTRFNYCLNLVLFILIFIEIISGLVISQVAIPFFEVETINDRSWRALHNLTLNWTVLAAGLHISVNWEWIILAVKRRISFLPLFPENQIWLVAMVTVFKRVFIFLCAAGLVAMAAYVILGKPSLLRLYSQDEIARFSPTAGHGVGQFVGEAFLIALVAYIGRKWLRVGL